MSGTILDAFVLHLEDHLFREWTAAMDAAEAAAWEPVRRIVAEVRELPPWEEQERRRQFPPPHRLRATPGWPPIAIPGQPGKYLTAQEIAA
ncbi:hypothetical protein [Kitasatospora sp. NPDC051914]|uniref:hypothetical protein n=1 Tax=Kitasatospora sp. NPDC051914 TaxID=3154945 RepID=UPI0034167E3D